MTSLSASREIETLNGADTDAVFERLVIESQDRALGLALRLLSGDRAGAEDVVQEAYLRAYKALPRFRGESTLKTWFDRIVVRETYRYLRSPWRRWFAGPTEDLDALPGEAASLEPSFSKPVFEALGALSANQRTVFVLVHLEGYTVQEAAQIMGRSVGTLKSHLHRALASLRDSLADVAREYDGLLPDGSAGAHGEASARSRS